MSKGNRGNGFTTITGIFLLIVAALIVMLIYDSGRKHGEAIGEYNANSDTYARHTQEQIQHCLTLPEDGTKSECMIHVIEASNEHERAEKDLVAQTEMALWALGMLVVSAFMLVVTALGVLWIRDTLMATKSAVKAAEDAVAVSERVGNQQVAASIAAIDAARDANQVAAKQFRAAFDPRLTIEVDGPFVDESKWPLTRFKDGERDRWVLVDIMIRVVSGGSHPATITGYDAYIVEPHFATNGPGYQSLRKVIPAHGQVTLFRGAAGLERDGAKSQSLANVAGFYLTPENRDRFTHEDSKVVVQVDYLDALKVRRQLSIGFMARGRGGIQGIWGGDQYNYDCEVDK